MNDEKIEAAKFWKEQCANMPQMAFPLGISIDDVAICQGLSKREYFAAAALAVISPGDFGISEIPAIAVRIADKLIAELAKPNGST